MVSADHETVKNPNEVSKRQFVCGLVELRDNRIKFQVNSEFLATSESSFSGIIPLDSADEAANLDKIGAAAEYFAELAQDLRQAAKLYQPETVPAVEAEVRPRNPQQQAEHLEMIHSILAKLPEAEQAIYQQFGFGERAKIYKMVDCETDPDKMLSIICSMINSIAKEKGHLDLS